MSHAHSHCGALRSAFIALPLLPPRHRSACIRPDGHTGRHRDIAGGTWLVTPEVADAVAVTMAARAFRDALGAGEERR